MRVPTLVLHARDFPFVKPEEATRLAALIPNARLAMVDGYDIMGDADQTVGAIEAFLADLPSSEESRTAQAVALSPAPSNLSERELEVLRLVAHGKSNPEIAKELFITRSTVQHHVSSILNKTGTQNRTEAVAYAKDHGIV